MIPQAYITAWRKKAPWQEDFQVEQDLVIERTLMAKDNIVSQKEYLENMEKKISDQDFLRDMEGLLRTDLTYKTTEAYEFVKTELLRKI